MSSGEKGGYYRDPGSGGGVRGRKRKRGTKQGTRDLRKNSAVFLYILVKLTALPGNEQYWERSIRFLSITTKITVILG